MGQIRLTHGSIVPRGARFVKPPYEHGAFDACRRRVLGCPAMEIREALPSEYDQVGDVVALAYEPFGTPDDQEWTQHIALVRSVADRAGRTVVLAAVEDGRD